MRRIDRRRRERLRSRVVSVGAQKLDAGMRVRAIERAPETNTAAVAKSSS